MWMVGYNNEGGEFNMVDLDHSFNGRKHRPLMPTPITSPSTITPPSLSHIHANNFFSPYHYHHLATVAEQNKREQCNAQPVVVSSRWNPTPEQLRALEELYRRGTRTPSAEQIQHITAQLKRFGKIEGKNVFYWFQNHKARERQKRRRQMESSSADQGQQHHDFDTPEKKDLAANRTVFEVEQTKNWAPSTNCSTLAEESVSTQRAAKAVVAECRTDGWLQFDEGELQQRRNFLERNATWHMVQLSCPPPPAPATHLINTLPNASAATCSMATVITTRIMDPNLIKTHQNLTFSLSPHHRENGLTSSTSDDEDEDDNIDIDNNSLESQTLQLFPLRSGDGISDHNINKETEISASALMNANLITPSQFFEFLPLKN